MTSSHDPSVNCVCRMIGELIASEHMKMPGGVLSVALPTVVPAECKVYVKPDFFKSLCTSATSFETDAVGVPNGMRQKSAIHDGGVARSDREISLLMTDLRLVRNAEAS